MRNTGIVRAIGVLFVVTLVYGEFVIMPRQASGISRDNVLAIHMI